MKNIGTHPRWNKSKTPSAYIRTGRPVGGGLVWNPTGSCKPPLTGGAIASLSSASKSGRCLWEELFVLRFVRPPSSIVFSLSSASTLLILGIAPLLVGQSAAVDLVLGRLLDALVESADAADFLCFMLVTAWEAESSASSPEASRDDGWRSSAVADCLMELCRVEVRFLFPEAEDEGDDMVIGRVKYKDPLSYT